MGEIGNLGSLIVFEVSMDKALTFKNMTQSVKGRWTVQNPILGKPYSEFLGPGQRTLSLSILLTAMHGVQPRETIERIEAAVEGGIPYKLVIGGKMVGNYQWVITDMSEAWEKIIQGGKLVSANLTLNLAEYR